MKKQCETPDVEKIEKTTQVFEEICTYLQPAGCDIFKLSRLILSTSMFDSIFLSLATTSKNYRAIATDTFVSRVAELRENADFKKYAGAASSNPSAINNKLIIARKILLDDAE